MNTSMLRRIALSTAAGAVLLGAMSTAHAQTAPDAQAAERTINVPAGPLSQSILTLSGQAGVQIVAEAGSLSGVNGQAVRGSMTFDAAMDQLLAGTGLAWRWLRPGVATIEQAPSAGLDADGSRVLGPVRVEGAQYATGVFGARARGDGVAQLGGVRGGQDEEAIGYRPRVATAGTGAPTALEDLPRTVTVVTQDQMAAQDIRTMSDVLDRLPGLTVVDDPGKSNDPFAAPDIYVRGFLVDRLQVDGGVARDLDIIGSGLLNLNAYERVELVHGSNAVFAGADSPGGSINLVRKRPGAATALEVIGTAGSWGRGNVQADYSTPSLSGSPIAFRGVASFAREGAFYDRYDKTDALLYGIVDAPLGDRARLELGGQYGQINANGGYSGILHYADGPLFNVPSDWNAYPEFAYSDARTVEVFGRLYMEILEDLDFEMGLSYQDQDLDSVQLSISSSVLSSGGEFGPSFFYALGSRGGSTQVGLDGKLAGKAETFGLSHNFYIAGSLNQRDSESSGRPVGSASPQTLADFLDPVFQPISPFAQGGNRSRSSVGSLVIGDTISWRNLVDLVLTLRRDMVDLSGYSLGFSADGSTTQGATADGWYQKVDREGEWVPSWALIFKPWDNLSVYFSRSAGFTRQDDVYSREGEGPDYIYAPLDPVEYDNLELGVKYGRDRWLATFAYYRNRQSNMAEHTGINTCPPGQNGGVFNSPCSRQSSAEYETTGLDLELAGEFVEGLDVVASYNWYDAQTDIAAGVNTFLPEHAARILVDWTPSSRPEWSFRGGLTYRSETFLSGSQDFYGPPPDLEYLGSSPFQYTADAYLVADVGATYRFSDSLSLDLYVENLTDELYYRTVNQTFNVPGNPRSFALTLRWRDLGAPPPDGLSPTNGLAPFGDPSDWYGAVDLGLQSSKDMRARAQGPAQDGVTPVIWSFDIEDKALASTRLGYRLGDAWRTELEAGYRAGEFSDIGGGAAAPFGVCRADLAMVGAPFDCDQASGGVSAWSLLFNVIRDFGREEARLRSFVGLGLGVTRATVEFDGKMEGIGTDEVPWLIRKTPESIVAQDVDLAPTWQAQVGLSFKLTDRATIDAAYRYVAIHDLTWGTYNMDRPFLIPGLVSPLTPRLGDFTGDYESQSLTIGLRWAFGAR